MDQYLQELSNIYNIENKLELKIFQNMESSLYDDSFVNQFKHAFISLNLEHISNLDYELIKFKNTKLEKETKINNSKITSEISKIKELRQLISTMQLDNFKKEFRAIEIMKDNLDILMSKFDSINIKKKYIMIDKPFEYDQVLGKDVIINKLPEKSINDTLIYNFTSALVSEKFSDEHINYILNIINSVKKGSSVILFTFLIPHYPKMYNLYILLCHIFKSVNIMFPLNLSITNNKAFFVCENKVNNIKITEDHLIDIKIKNSFPEYEKKLFKFELEVFKFVKSCFKLLTYLLIIKEKDELKYNIIKYKILYRILPKVK